MREMLGDVPSKVAVGFLLIVVTAALVAPMIATTDSSAARHGSDSGLSASLRHDPNEIDLSQRLQGPSLQHPMGTDELGRDVFARIIHGARVSLAVGIAAGVIALFVGSMLGVLAATSGGWIDAMVLRLIEIALCFPFYFVALAVVSVMGPSITSLLVALVLTSWTGEARLVRGEVLRLRGGNVVEAARSSGAGRARIMMRHVLPNVITPAIVSSGFGVAAAILAESALSFLGFGVPLPLSSWGSMLASAQDHLLTAWWLALFPGIAIALTVGAIQILVERVRRRVAVEAATSPIR